MLSILVVEDAVKMANLLKMGLSEEGYKVSVASDGETGLKKAQTGDFDLILLDINLPKLDGFGLIRQLRRSRSDVPVIMVTARDSMEDKISGLDDGADDYLVKPFAFEELLARIRTVMRRPGSRDIAQLTFDDIVLNSSSGKVWRSDKELYLTPKEFNLLRVFMQRADRILSREELEMQAWETEYDVASNRLDVYVNYLRNKLESGGKSRLIQTIRGKGYRLGYPREDCF